VHREMPTTVAMKELPSAAPLANPPPPTASPSRQPLPPPSTFGGAQSPQQGAGQGRRLRDGSCPSSYHGSQLHGWPLERGAGWGETQSLVPTALPGRLGVHGGGGPSHAPWLLHVLIWGTPPAPQQVCAIPGQGQMLSELPWVLSPPGAMSRRWQGKIKDEVLQPF